MHGTQPGGRAYRMTGATIVALVVLSAGVTFTVARASNDPDARARAVRKDCVQDEDRMNPSREPAVRDQDQGQTEQQAESGERHHRGASLPL